MKEFNEFLSVKLILLLDDELYNLKKSIIAVYSVI